MAALTPGWLRADGLAAESGMILAAAEERREEAFFSDSIAAENRGIGCESLCFVEFGEM